MDFEKVIHQLDPTSKLIRTWTLTGGVSAIVTALEVQHADGTYQRYVMRQHGAVDRANNPQVAADEFNLLKRLHAAGLPVPKPYLFDEGYIITEYIDGEIRSSHVDVNQLAGFLARLHQCTETGSQVMLHGDLWLGNVLWKNGQIAAVIDWEDARLGNPFMDVANTRLELLWALGTDAMTQFTAAYQAQMPHLNDADLPHYDLQVASRAAKQIASWGKSAEEETQMRHLLDELVLNALKQIG